MRTATAVQMNINQIIEAVSQVNDLVQSGAMSYAGGARAKSVLNIELRALREELFAIELSDDDLVAAWMRADDTNDL